METKNFKKIFGELAKSHGFESAFGGWFRESKECILFLELQRSNYSPLYYLNIKIYIQGCQGRTFFKSKELLKNTGNVLSSYPVDYQPIFDLESPIDDNLRSSRLENFFCNFLCPFTEKALTRQGLKELVQNREACIGHTHVQEELGL